MDYASNRIFSRFCFFFFNDTATTEIYTLSLHDALPIYDGVDDLSGLLGVRGVQRDGDDVVLAPDVDDQRLAEPVGRRSEEHTSELQSQSNLVCRLLLEKKK